MVHKGNCHTQVVCAVATHLISRIHAILKDDRSYELYDIEGKLISNREAKILIKRELTVPEGVRQRTHSRKRVQRRKKGYKHNQVRDLVKLLQASRFV